MKSKRLIGAMVCLALVAPAFGAAGFPKFATVNKAVVNYKALQPNLQAVGAVVVEIDPGFHSQSNKPTGKIFEAATPEESEKWKDGVRFTVTVDPNDAIVPSAPVYPEGKSEKFQFDPANLNVYEGRVTVYIPFQVKGDAKPGAVKLTGKVNYQCCDANACYQPQSLPFVIETTIMAAELQYDDVFKDYNPTATKKSAAVTPLAPEKNTWTTALDAARKERRVIVVVFTAAWSTATQYPNLDAMRNPEVASLMKKQNVELLRVDLTKADAPGWTLLKAVVSDGVAAIPYTVVYGPGITTPIRLPGTYSSRDLINAITKAGAK
jgi:thiol:disulfide interchange protein